MPLPPADRVDAWLRRQTGWRLGVLFWLQIDPPVMMLCCSAWFFFANPSVATVLWSAAVSAPVAALLFFPLRRRMRRRGLPLVQSWRLIAGLMFLLAGSLADGFSQNEIASHHGHDVWEWAGPVLWLIAIACFADAARRGRVRSAGRFHALQTSLPLARRAVRCNGRGR